MNRHLGILLASAMLAAFPTIAKADCDGAQVIQLATNMIFGWQQPNGASYDSCDIHQGTVLCGFNDLGNPSHQWYVDNITASYIRDLPENLRAIYFRFTRHDDAANHLGGNCSLTQIKQAAAHAISCYPPSHGGAFIGYGAAPTWPEAAAANLATCVNP